MEKHSFLKAIWMYKIVILVLSLVGFLLAFFVTDFIVNQNFSYYTFNFKSDTAAELIMSKDYISERVEAFDDYNSYVTTYNKKVNEYYTDSEGNTNIPDDVTLMSSKKLSSGYNYASIANSAKIIENEDGSYTIKIKYSKFKTTFVSSKQTVSKGVTKAEANFEKLLTWDLKYFNFENGVCSKGDTVSPKYTITLDYTATNNYDGGFKVDGYNNPYAYGGFTALAMFLISICLFFILSKGRNDDYLTDISDNRNIFRSPFYLAYWKEAALCFKKVKNLAGIAVLFAMMLVCKLIPIPSGFGNLGISFTYLFFSMISMIYGPIAGLVVGIFSDVIGYFIGGASGVFFPGYTLDAMLAGFIYGLCFYKTKLTFAKCLYARLIVNLFVNVVMGSLWYCIVYIGDFTLDSYVTYVTIISLPKNLIYLLPQTILLFIVLRAMTRPFAAFGLIDQRVRDHVTLF